MENKTTQNDIFATIQADPGFLPVDNTGTEIPDIKVIGVGGGGVNALERLVAQQLKGVTLLAVNTDNASLSVSSVNAKLCIGNGKGAGDKPEKARQAAEEAAERINHMLDDGTNMVFVLAGMGGGTGTGAAPVVARIAHERGLLTVGVVTIPFLFEGRPKVQKALIGAELMSQFTDALIMIDNQSLIDCYPDNTMMENFALADATVARAVTSINELIYTTGFWNIDFNDIDTTLRGKRVAVISYGEGKGENRVTQAIDVALQSPLIKNRDVFGASRLLIAVTTSSAPQHTLKASEIRQVENFKNKFRSHEVEQITGWYYDDALEGKVKVTILAAGFALSFSDDRALPEYTILTPEQMDDDQSIAELEATPTLKRVATETQQKEQPSNRIVF